MILFSRFSARKHLRSRALAASAATVALCAAVAASVLAEPVIVSMQSTITQDGRTQTMTRKEWTDGPTRVRVEVMAAGRSQTTIVNGADAWLILPGQKSAYHQRLSAVMAAALARQSLLQANAVPQFLKQGGKKVGQERVNGVPCNVYRRTEKNGVVVTLWAAASGRQLPARALAEGTIKAPGAPPTAHRLRSETQFTWQVGTPIAASMFRVPAGYAVKEMPTGPRPGAPSAPRGR